MHTAYCGLTASCPVLHGADKCPQQPSVAVHRMYVCMYVHMMGTPQHQRRAPPWPPPGPLHWHWRTRPPTRIQPSSPLPLPLPCFPSLQDCPSGSTALVGLLLGGDLWLANVGDCRAVVCDDAEARWAMPAWLAGAAKPSSREGGQGGLGTGAQPWVHGTHITYHICIALSPCAACRPASSVLHCVFTPCGPASPPPGS